MNWPYLPLVSCAFLVATLGFGQSAPDHMKLFLLIGQSNMAGRGLVGPEDQITNPRIFMLTKEETWMLAESGS